MESKVNMEIKMQELSQEQLKKFDFTSIQSYIEYC